MNFDDLFNVPYKERGRDTKIGLDCYGLVLELSKRAGNPLPDIATYSAYKETGLKEVIKPKEGDIMETMWEGRLHCGYMLSSLLVVHMTDKGAQIVPFRVFENPKFFRKEKNENKVI